MSIQYRLSLVTSIFICDGPVPSSLSLFQSSCQVIVSTTEPLMSLRTSSPSLTVAPSAFWMKANPLLASNMPQARVRPTLPASPRASVPMNRCDEPGM